MGKHFKPIGPVKSNDEIETILQNTLSLSRWAALIEGISIIDQYEPIEVIPINSNRLLKFIDGRAPYIQQHLEDGS